MDNTESGQKGGLATRDSHITLCPLCGNPVKNQFFSENGKKGGGRTLELYGREHYVKAGRMGGRGNKRNGHPRENVGGDDNNA